MIDILVTLGIVGLVNFLLPFGYIVFIFFLYLVYKSDGGKMGLIEYFRIML